MLNIPLHTNKVVKSTLDLTADSRDASFYSIKPEVIVKPSDEFDIIALLEYASLNGKSLTFRAAGTSLSGQSLTSSVLVDLSGSWKSVEVIENGNKIKSQPGVIGENLNRKLHPYGRVIGPDPASISACMLGGILANNSSGMRSGIVRNAYNTIVALRFILANGILVDTSYPDADDRLKKNAPDIYEGLLNIKKEIQGNESLTDKIKEQYAVKNVVGYSLNSFLDYDGPVDILAHLFIGSEGTLGFISNATLLTYPDKTEKLTGMLLFKNVNAAAAAIIPVRATGVSALEIVDNKSLQSVSDLPAIKEILGVIDDSMSILLFEFQEAGRNIIEEKLVNLIGLARELNLETEPLLIWDSSKQEELWSIRSGLLPSLGASRTPGTTFILEDICFPLDKIDKAIPALLELFDRFDYKETGIYGHGMDGDLHFMLTQNFAESNEINRYAAFMDALAELVIERFGGSMKAEHGTGRSIAPFVEKQWGNDAYTIMKRIKRLLDPGNILNPGVLINEDKSCHLKNIKTYPVLNNDADNCIECGFCEPVCLSADLTQSPRKRIVLMRERIREDIQTDIFDNWDYEYNVDETCAVDGLCSLVCPVEINTGELVKSNRDKKRGKLGRKLADFLSTNFNVLESGAKVAVLSGHFAEFLFSEKGLNRIINAYKRVLRLEKVHHWNDKTGYPEKIIPRFSQDDEFLYFPTCISRVTGKPVSNNVFSLFDVISEVSAKAKIKLKIPEKVNNYCCGTIFSSKGFHDAYVKSINKLIDMFWNETGGGKLPVIFDSSSCVQTAKTCRNDLNDDLKQKYDDLTILDISEYLADYVLSRVHIKKKLNQVVLHQTCSSVRLNIENKIEQIAKTCACEVVILESQRCCGMAGDRGLLFPELTESATSGEAAEISLTVADGYYSSNLPCETAMSSATGKQYLSVAYLVLNAIE